MFLSLFCCWPQDTEQNRTNMRNISAHTSCTSLVPRNMLYKNRQPSISLHLIIISSSNSSDRPSSSGQFKAHSPRQLMVVVLVSSEIIVTIFVLLLLPILPPFKLLWTEYLTLCMGFLTSDWLALSVCHTLVASRSILR